MILYANKLFDEESLTATDFRFFHNVKTAQDYAQRELNGYLKCLDPKNEPEFIIWRRLDADTLQACVLGGMSELLIIDVKEGKL